MSFVRSCWCVILLTLSLTLAAAQPAPPAPPLSHASIPRLTSPLVLDGNITEWGDALQIPVQDAACVAYQVPGSAHDWRGLADASMLAHVAWNAEGICVAFQVRDNEVRNSRPDHHLWVQDSVELLIDGRMGQLRQPPYTPGAYQIFLRPPVPPTHTAVLAVRGSDGIIPAARVGGSITPGGYNIEAVIPWSAFPGLLPGPGAAMGLQCALNDCDARDGEVEQPRMLTVGGVSSLFNSPQNLMPVQLVDSLPAADRVLTTLPVAPPSSVSVPGKVPVQPYQATLPPAPPSTRTSLEYYVEDILPIGVVIAMGIAILLVILLQVYRPFPRRRSNTNDITAAQSDIPSELAPSSGFSGYLKAGIGFLLTALVFVGTGFVAPLAPESNTTFFMIAILLATVGCSLLGIGILFNLDNKPSAPHATEHEDRLVKH